MNIRKETVCTVIAVGTLSMAVTVLPVSSSSAKDRLQRSCWMRSRRSDS